jgi:glucose-fructose oxidoreductase
MAPAKKIGYAVVGLGSIAKSSVLPAFAYAKHARLVAVVGRKQAHADAIAKQFRAPHAYTSADFSKCLANPEVDAVYIATPPGAHLEFVLGAAKAGKHILCEKPLAATVAQAEKIVAAARKYRVQLMTAYRKNFEPSTLYVKELVQSGALGRIDAIHTTFSELHVPGKSLDWLLSSSMAGGGPLTDLGVYCLNTSRWILGKDPTSPIAQSWRNEKRYRHVEQGISFRLTFPGNTVLHGSSSYGAVLSSLLFIQGTKGWLSLTPAFPFDEDRLLTGKIEGRWLEKKFKIVDEFAPELDALAKAVQTGKRIQPDGEQGLRDMKIIRAIYQSAKQHKPVQIKY